MKEADLQRWVIEVARRFGWKVWHVPAPMVWAGKRGFVPAKQGAGLPDLILVHSEPPRLVFAELKGDGHYDVTEGQREFLQAVKAVAEFDWTGEGMVVPLDGRAVGVYVWQPGMERPIEDLLRSRVLS